MQSIGDKLVVAAEKKQNPGKFLFLFHVAPELEVAAELYEKAAIVYKLDNKWDKAGKAYEAKAACQMKLDEKEFSFDMARTFQSAAEAYKHVSVLDSIRCYTRASDLYLNCNNLTASGKQWNEVAKLHWIQTRDTKEAIKAYQKAIHLFKSDNLSERVVQCEEKLVTWLIEEKRFTEAAEIFKSHANKENIKLWNVCPLLVRANLCLLFANQDLFQDERTIYQESAVAKHIQELKRALDEKDFEKFSQCTDIFAESMRIGRNVYRMVRKKKRSKSSFICLLG